MALTHKASCVGIIRKLLVREIRPSVFMCMGMPAAVVRRVAAEEPMYLRVVDR